MDDANEALSRMRSRMESQFGPAPVLSWENPDQFYRIMLSFWRVYHDGKGNDVTEYLIWEITTCIWNKIRMMRVRDRLHEAEYDNFRQLQIKRRQAQKDREVARKDDKEVADLIASGEPGSQEIKKLDLEDKIAASVRDIDDLLQAAFEDRDHARAFQKCFDAIERISALTSTEDKKEKEIIRMLEFNVGATMIVQAPPTAPAAPPGFTPTPKRISPACSADDIPRIWDPNERKKEADNYDEPRIVE